MFPLLNNTEEKERMPSGVGVSLSVCAVDVCQVSVNIQSGVEK